MQGWQDIDRDHLLAGNGQLAVAPIEESRPQQSRVDLKILVTQSPLDYDFPQARGTKYAGTCDAMMSVEELQSQRR